MNNQNDRQGKIRTNALDRAYLEMKPKLDELHIEVPKSERRIIFDNLIVDVRFGTPRTDCRRKLKKMIAYAEKKKMQETQETLL